ncbi:MAG: hypothetical protein LBE32_07445 [Burkholderiales bacterium]|jgi:hypothetical protein|nr:hypothetical protein [Burkholderiales bacterium]
MLSRLARFLWKAVKWTFLVAMTLFTLAVLINWRDEALSDEALALLETTPIKVPDNENIFVAMAGFNAPEGDDIFEVGRRRIEKIEKELEKDPSGFKLTFEGFKEQGEREELRWQEMNPPFDCLYDEKTDFLECIHSQKDRLEKTLTANETLIRRYHLLHELPHYATHQNPNALFFMEWYSAASYVQRSLVARALLDIESRNADAGLTFFRKEQAFWRRIFEEKSFLFDSMAAMTMMTINVHRLSLLLSSASVNVEGQALEWREMLMPLSHEQYRLRSAIKGEIRFMHNVLPTMKKRVSYQEEVERLDVVCPFIKTDTGTCSAWRVWLKQNFQTFFFQPNATFNYGVPFFKTWLSLTDLPWKEYIEQRDEALAPLAVRSEPGIGWIYNPVGKGQSHYIYLWDTYVGRLHDLDAYLRMVRLQLELRLKKIPSEEISAFIEQLDEAYCAPCSDFSWDAETRMLSFQPYRENSFLLLVSASVYVPE